MSQELFAAKKRNEAQKKKNKTFASFCAFSRLIFLLPLILFSSCADIQKPRIEQFYGGEVKLPQKKQEFRWSNGKLPKQLDPALASAPPETDLVRAVYEGLTDLDAKTLEPQPSVAESWEVSDDGRTWTFHLRKDAKWTNGVPVTAKDFARSWRRLAEMGTAVPHSKLLKNIVGAENFAIDDGISILPAEEFEDDLIGESLQDSQKLPNKDQEDKAAGEPKQENAPSPAEPKKAEPEKKEPAKPAVKKWFGVEAVDDLSLRVWLIQPDRNFPAVTAHPVFRPIYEDAANLDALDRSPKAVTNGAFHIASVGKEEVLLARSDSFWGRDLVGLEKVRLIAKPDAESALAAYQANEIDAVTNNHFEPLALKLLAPYEDYRRTTHNALTYYQFNFDSVPFDDPRIRRALAIAIERETIVQDEMYGAGQPALDFLPFAESPEGGEGKLGENIPKAKQLLAEAGYADTAAFPKIRLLINRNDLQRRIANSVKAMWKKNLGIETEVILKDRAEYEEAIKNGEYDLVRRGAVLPTADETSSMLAMFDPFPDEMSLMERLLKKQVEDRQEKLLRGEGSDIPSGNTRPNSLPQENLPAGGPYSEYSKGAEQTPKTETKETPRLMDEGIASGKTKGTEIILTEKKALEKIPAIPLYFPVSNSLVKPYVSGFDTNLLDAPSLKTVVINGDWKNSPPQK